ncbi:MAG: hypothetical protein MUF14_04420 [Hyphomonadaceae bacterium]|jgi:hypothetical protein|nr:hypothetical protein [Hyphomonadaceae bacterium]
MLASATALFAAMLASDAGAPAQAGTSDTDAPAAVSQTSPAERFAGRAQARIPFESSIRSWRFEREGNDDILYVEGPRRAWYRAELTCFGLASDADFALGMIPITRGGGFDRFSSVRFVDGTISRHHGTDCRLLSLVALTEEEAFEFDLRRRPREPSTR